MNFFGVGFVALLFNDVYDMPFLAVQKAFFLSDSCIFFFLHGFCEIP